MKPKVAWRMLQCSNTRGYELLAAGELDSFLDGRSRKITIESIRRYIECRLSTKANPGPRRRRQRREAHTADRIA